LIATTENCYNPPLHRAHRGGQRWRALYVKATLEAVEAGIVTMEDAWLSWTMLPGGTSASAWMQPQIEQAYESGRMPPLLPGPT
jgi:hypothetical protein